MTTTTGRAGAGALALVGCLLLTLVAVTRDGAGAAIPGTAATPAPGYDELCYRPFTEAGDVDRARQIDEELAPAYEILGLTVGPIGIKAALNLLGHDVGGLRLPLVEADEGELARIRAALERVGALTPERV